MHEIDPADSAAARQAAVDRTLAQMEQAESRRSGWFGPAWIVLGGAVVLSVIAGGPSPGSLTGWILFAAPLAAIAVMAYLHWVGSRYRSLVAAGSRGSWREVLDRIESMERWPLGVALLRNDLRLRRATALLGLGREEEAVDLVAALEAEAPTQWMLLGSIAGFHLRRRDLDRARVCIEGAAQVGAADPASQLALAEHYADHRVKDLDRARAALERARSRPLPTAVRWAVERIEGQIAVEEGRWVLALGHLANAADGVRKLADNGLNGLILAHIAAYQAIALGGLGLEEEGRRVFERRALARWLEPHDSQLLERVRAAVR